MAEVLRRTWAEVDLAQLVKNVEIYRGGLSADTAVMAVVKADAYGHGAAAVAPALQEAGVSHFAVATVDEAIALRRAGVTEEILILGYTPPENAALLEEYDLTQALLSPEYAADLAAACSAPIKCHFAIDTGMNRIGLDADDPAATAAVIRQYATKLRLTGIFTHLCVADSAAGEDVAFTREQIEKFQNVATRVSDIPLLAHCLNSAGGLFYAKTHSALARLGIVMYGLRPDYANTLPAGIRPTLAWKTVVAMVKTVYPGESVGYGRAARPTREMRVATLPVGYADGYNRRLSNGVGYVLLHGKRAPVVGRVCMDQIMVDVTDIPATRAGDEVILLGESGGECLTADDMAQALGTIGYEVVCNISARVPRIYR